MGRSTTGRTAVGYAAGVLSALVLWQAVEVWQYMARLPAASAQAVALPLRHEPAASARVHSGQPNFKAVEYSASADGEVQTGIFSAEGPSTFDWRYGVDEAIYIHEGEVQLDYLGRTFTAGAGDTVFFRAGTQAVWHVPKYVRKSWTIYEPGRAIRWYRRLVAALQPAA